MATAGDDIRTIAVNQISWGAVFAGVVVMLAIHIILNLLGLGVGTAVLDPGTGDNPDAETFSGVAALWWTLSGILASLIGGYVAGRTSGTPDESSAGYHGVAAWATTILVIFFFLTSSVGTVVGGFYGTLSGIAEQAAGDEGDGANPIERLKQEADKMMGQAPADPAAPGATPAPSAPDAETADAAATLASIGSFFAALALLAGGFASWVGATIGAVNPIRSRSRTAAAANRRRR